MRSLALSAVAFLLTASNVQAGFLIRIGDRDGFGYGTAPGFYAANGGFANIGEVGILSDGDFLPDINSKRDGTKGAVRNGDFDEFDFRSVAELDNTAVVANANVILGTQSTGSKFTDISLTESYGDRSKNEKVLVGGNPDIGLARDTGGPFPDGNAKVPNEATFVFDFYIDKANLPDGFNPSNGIFFNLLFGDYDVTPAKIEIKGVGPEITPIDIDKQDPSENGLIQSASTTFSFGDVFTEDDFFYHGYLRVDFKAPLEPYMAFDYVELSLVPEPSSVVAFLTGLAGLLLFCRKQLNRTRKSSGCSP
jgi:hypothetical protein